MTKDHDLDALNAEILRLYQMGDYQAATPLAERATKLSEQVLGPDHPDVGTSFSNLALFYYAEGRFADAEPLYKRVLSIFEKALGPDHPHVGATLNNLADLYSAQGRYADADPLHKRVLSIFEKALGPDHPNVATSLNNRAWLYYTQSRYADAEPLFNRAISIIEKALGPHHPDICSTLNNLAHLYRAQGRYAESEPLSKRSLTIREKAFGPDHPNVGTSLNNLAEVYRAQGRYTDAEPLYKRDLAISEKTLGPYHKDVGQCLNNLAEVYRAQGRYTDAEPLYKRSLAIRERALGPDHPDVGATLNNLAELYRALGRYTDAEPLYKRVAAMPGWEVADIPILFATNRRPEPTTGWKSFSAQQEVDITKISFGKAIVRAPKSEVVNKADRFADALGQRDRVMGRQTSFEHLSIRAVEVDTDGAVATDAARDRLSRAARFPGQAFVFVHGYNTSFEDAVRRTAMIAYDLDFDGATFLFTWPSHAKLASYRVDRKRARVAAPFLIKLLHKIGAELPEVKLHVLAHSTGGEIALSALMAIADDVHSSRPRLGELILAHADVDPARLGRAVPSLRTLGMGVTSYSSSIDWAMRISRAIRLMLRTRVGAAPVCIEGVDSIDITGLSGGLLALNHTVFVDNPMVFGDMNRLMSNGERRPDQRTSFFVPVKTRRGTHWEYRNAKATG